MPKRKLPPDLRRQVGAKLRQMREQAHLRLEIAAPRLDKSRSALHRVETGETRANVHLVRSMMDLYDTFDPTLLDEVRAANNPSTSNTRTHPNRITTGSSTVPTDQSEVDNATPKFEAPESVAEDEAFDNLLIEMVTDQAPRIFAVVIEHGHREDAAIAAWGMAFEDNAYMVTANGNNHYSLTTPENALNYVRINPHTTPHLIWADSTVANPFGTQN